MRVETADRVEYQRQWRKKHPNYKRDWMREKRGCNGGNSGLQRGRVLILGVPVNPFWVKLPAVTCEQAEKEFLALTDGI